MAATAAGQQMVLRQQQMTLLRHVLVSPALPRVTTQRCLGSLQIQRGTAAAAAAGAAEPAPAAQEREFTCVRLRGLPFDVTEEQLAALLGCELVDFFCVNRQGRFSGDAFVVLGSEQQVAAALAKDRSSMGRRYIEVYKARRAEYYRAIAAEVNSGSKYSAEERSSSRALYGSDDRSSSRTAESSPGPSSSSRSSRSRDPGEDTSEVKVLLLRGLPFKAQKEDIVQWFDDVTELGLDDVRIVTDRGRSAGIALVRFATPQDAQDAAAAKHKQHMGSRYIEVYPCSRDEVQGYIDRSH